MKRISILVLIAVFFIQCSRVPLTGRKQFAMMPESLMQGMAASQYQAFLATNKPTAGTSDVDMVKRVGNRIITAVTNYMTSRNMQNQIAGYKWETNLVNNKEANAWCMPGGKIVVYTGILPITQNEAGLAAVMGHEVAHAIAKHGNERMSQAVLAQGLQIAAAIALAEKGDPNMNNTYMQAIGIGTQVGVLLPFSRKHELEADKMGTYFMSMAGYNPNEAVNLWKRMSQRGGAAAPPEFMSTHPSNERRIAELQKIMPVAMKLYQPQ